MCINKKQSTCEMKKSEAREVILGEVRRGNESFEELLVGYAEK